MPRMPGAQWRPLALDWARQPRIKRHDLVVLHTMVGSLDGTDAYFRGDGYGGVESHFGVGGEGRVLQWQDTDFQAEANGSGNYRIISVETEDRNSRYFPQWDSNDGSAVPAWTDAQLEAIASVVAWCCTVHDIPCVLAPSSRSTSRGVGYHRQGIDGNFPDGRVPGGEVWSSALGKVCPGNRRIAQVPKVIERARRIMGGVSVVEPPASRGGIVIPVQLPRTDPGPEGSPASAWPWREEVIDLGYVGGWRGRCMVRLSFGHPGGQVLRAHFDTATGPETTIFHVPGVGDWPGTWVDPAYKNPNRFTVEAPAGATALMLTYAAPGGASLNVEWER